MQDIDDLEDSFFTVLNANQDGENNALRIGTAFLNTLSSLIKPYSSKRKKGYVQNELVVFKKTIYQATGVAKQGQSPETDPNLWSSNFATNTGQITETGENYAVGTRLLSQYVKAQLSNFKTEGTIPDIDKVGKKGNVTDIKFDLGGITYTDLESVTAAFSFLVTRRRDDGKLETVQISLSDLKKLIGATSNDNGGGVKDPVTKIPAYKILSLERAVADEAEIKPNAPSGLKIIEVSEGKFQFDFYDNSNNEAGFEIEDSINGGAFFVYKKLAANTTTTGILSDYDATKNHTVRVRAYNKIGYSDYSNSTVYVAPLKQYPKLPKTPNLPDITTYVGDKVNKQFADFEYIKPEDLTREMLNLPSGLAWDAVTRTVIGESPLTEVRDVTYKATDKTNGIGQGTFRWTVLRKLPEISQVTAEIYDSPQFADYALLLFVELTLDDSIEWKFDNLPDTNNGTPIADNAPQKQWHSLNREVSVNGKPLGKLAYFWSYYKESSFPEMAPPIGTIVRFYVRPKSNPTAVKGPYEVPVGGSLVYGKTVLKSL